MTALGAKERKKMVFGCCSFTLEANFSFDNGMALYFTSAGLLITFLAMRVSIAVHSGGNRPGVDILAIVKGEKKCGSRRSRQISFVSCVDHFVVG